MCDRGLTMRTCAAEVHGLVVGHLDVHGLHGLRLVDDAGLGWGRLMVWGTRHGCGRGERGKNESADGTGRVGCGGRERPLKWSFPGVERKRMRGEQERPDLVTGGERRWHHDAVVGYLQRHCFGSSGARWGTTRWIRRLEQTWLRLTKCAPGKGLRARHDA